MVDTTFDYIMTNYYTDGYNSVEANPAYFETFGVLENHMASYINNSIGYSEGYIDDFKQNELNSSIGNGPALLMANASGNYSHMVVYVGYELYNNNWNIPESKIYIMNPFYGQYEEKSLAQIMQGYGNVYQ